MKTRKKVLLGTGEDLKLKVSSNPSDIMGIAPKGYVETLVNEAKLYTDSEIAKAITIVVDAQLSTTSENPVQNKVVTSAIDNKLSKVTNSIQENNIRLYCVNKDGTQNMAIVNLDGSLIIDNI